MAKSDIRVMPDPGEAAGPTDNRAGKLPPEEAMAFWFAHTDALFCVTDESFRFSWLSESWGQVLDIADQEMIGRPLLDIIDARDRDRAGALLEELNSGPGPVHLRARCRFTGGHGRMIEWQLARAGAGDTHFGFARDVTKAWQTDRDLHHHRAEFQSIADNLEVVLWQSDLDDRLVFANRTCCIWYACAHEDIIGKTRAELLGEEFVRATRPHVEQVLAGQKVQYEIRNSYPDGVTRDVAVTYAPRRDGNGDVVGYYALAQDISELKAARSQLQRAVKMETAGQLTGGLAHDFNNLLGIIVGNLDLTRELVEQDEEAVELLDEAIEAATRGSDLTQSLLAYARQQSLKPARIDVAKTLERITKLLKRSLGERVVVRFFADEDVWPIEVDRAQLESCIVNLGVNARDAMPNGGKLTIEVENGHISEQYAAHHVDAKPGEYVKITISDTGCGMDADVAAKVFDPFFTTKVGGKGTGLGLSMVAGFIGQSGGHINLYSELGQGTVIRIYLPRADRDAADVETASGATAESCAPERTALLVEDNAAMRRMTGRQLRGLGFHVIEAEDADKALDALNAKCPDLVVSDVVMPGSMDGVDLAEYIAETHPDLPVILASGFTERGGQEDRMDDIAALGAPFLQKPFRKSDLSEAIQNVLDPQTDPS